MRKWLWLFLILAGVAFPIVVGIKSEVGAGPVVAAGIISVFTWIGASALLSHIFGVRRRLKSHLAIGDDWKNVAIVTHVIPTAERANFQLALDDLRGAEPRPKPVYGVQAGERGLTT